MRAISQRNRAYPRSLALAVAAAALLHLLAALVVPPFRPRPYRLRERPVEVVELAPEYVLPRRPPPIARPEPPGPSPADRPLDRPAAPAAEEAGADAPGRFDPFAAPSSDGGGGAPGGGPGGGGPGVGIAYDTPPEAVQTEPPLFPEEARRAGWSGTIHVRISVDTAGRVTAVAAEDGAGQPAVQRAALEAARRWRFRPARRNGVPVAAEVVVPFRFDLPR